MKKTILTAALALFTMSMPVATYAQEATTTPTIAAPHKQTINYRERTLCYNIPANVEFTVTTATPWLTIRREDNGTIYLHATQNLDNESRVGEVIFKNEAYDITEKMTIIQTRDESVETIPTDGTVRPTSATTNTAQNG